MEDGGFFDFDTALPVIMELVSGFLCSSFFCLFRFMQIVTAFLALQLARRGPQQEFGDVELEDTYDALNDETFGGVTAGGEYCINLC